MNTRVCALCGGSDNVRYAEFWRWLTRIWKETQSGLARLKGLGRLV